MRPTNDPHSRIQCTHRHRNNPRRWCSPNYCKFSTACKDRHTRTNGWRCRIVHKSQQVHPPTLVDHTRAVNVPVGIASTRWDGVVPATANSVPPPVLAPREPVPPTPVAVAGHGHDRRADVENAAYVWVPPRLLAVVLPHCLLAPPSLDRPASCPYTTQLGVRTFDMAHRQSGVRFRCKWQY